MPVIQNSCSIAAAGQVGNNTETPSQDGNAVTTCFQLIGSPKTLTGELLVSVPSDYDMTLVKLKNNLTNQDLTLTSYGSAAGVPGLTYFRTGILASSGPFNITLTYSDWGHPTQRIPYRTLYVYI